VTTNERACQATAVLAGMTLVCDHEQAPHPGLMHVDRSQGQTVAIWWGEGDDGPVLQDLKFGES
jgi:hypothetical protein